MTTKLYLTESKFTAERGTCYDSYQSMDIVQEVEQKRKYVKFTLFEKRWRSKEEAADYLRWAAGVLESLP